MQETVKAWRPSDAPEARVPPKAPRLHPRRRKAGWRLCQECDRPTVNLGCVCGSCLTGRPPLIRRGGSKPARPKTEEGIRAFEEQLEAEASRVAREETVNPRDEQLREWGRKGGSMTPKKAVAE